MTGEARKVGHSDKGMLLSFFMKPPFERFQVPSNEICRLIGCYSTGTVDELCALPESPGLLQIVTDLSGATL